MYKNNEIISEPYKGCLIKIVQDDDPATPRDFCNIGTMVCSHRAYNLGDEQADNVDLESLKGNAQILPLYLYDHSGISMSTKPFSCAWDSCRVGIIFCTLETAINAFKLPGDSNWSTIIQNSFQRDTDLSSAVREALEQEVVTYNDYLTGNVSGLVVESINGFESDVIDSIWGYYPDHRVSISNQWDNVLEEGKLIVDAWVHEQMELEIGNCANI